MAASLKRSSARVSPGTVTRGERVRLGLEPGDIGGDEIAPGAIYQSRGVHPADDMTSSLAGTGMVNSAGRMSTKNGRV